MTTTFFLVRHGTHPLLGKVLAGRMSDLHLDANGREQAQRLAERLSRERIDMIQTSPLERTVETATPIAERARIPLATTPALTEVDVGEWTGKPFSDLAHDPRWKQWNTVRSAARPPGGESMLEVQRRAVGELERIRAAIPEGRIVLVSHSDVIRAALLYHLAMSIDDFAKIEVAPAAISTLVVGDWGAKLMSLNEVPAA